MSALSGSVACDYFPSELLQSSTPDASVDGPAVIDARQDSGEDDLLRLDAPLDQAPQDTSAIDLALADSASDAPVPDKALPVDLSPGDTAPLADQTAPPDSGIVAPGTWVKIPAGSFTMGSPASEPCRNANELQHTVTLTNAFWISTTEVTQAQFLATMSYNPATATTCSSSCPVETVSWSMAAAYCNALSAANTLAACYSCSGSGAGVSCATATPFSGGKIYSCPGFRLPTEAEWEYAYRAKTSSAYYSGANTVCKQPDPNATLIGWYKGTGAPQPVGGKAPNAWGLYDMAGNVYERCHDWYTANLGAGAVTDPWGPATGTVHVLRGGCWGWAVETLRAAHRNVNPGGVNGAFVGFRCVRTSK